MNLPRKYNLLTSNNLSSQQFIVTHSGNLSENCQLLRDIDFSVLANDKNIINLRLYDKDKKIIEFDYVTARKKSDAIQTEVNLIEKFSVGKPRAAIKSIKRLREKIRRMRRAGLHSPEQEYSAENIAFKILRREETLDKLSNMKYDTYDRVLSMDE